MNKAGRLQVYIHTAKGVLIEVNPSVRIPRTFKRFCGLMGMHCFCIEKIRRPTTLTAASQCNCFTDSLSVPSTVQKSYSRLLRCAVAFKNGIKIQLKARMARIEPNNGPSANKLPQNQLVGVSTNSIAADNPLSALSFDAEPVKLSKYLPTLPDTHSICVFVGAMAHGCAALSHFLPIKKTDNAFKT